MAIIVSTNGKNARKLHESQFDSEMYLQQYVADNPDSLPMDQIKENIRLLIIGREFPTASGPIDVLAADQDGDIYIVETKLFKNPDKRRVVAQVLDYGAALWMELGADGFSELVNEWVVRQTGLTLTQKMSEFYTVTAQEGVSAVDAIKSNLNEGNFKFVVLMDRLHADLKRLIQFLNAKSRFTIDAVEMEYYRHEAMEIIIPRLFGAETRKDDGPVRASTNVRKWDEPSYFEELSRNIPVPQQAAVQVLYELAKRDSDEWFWGTGTKRGSFSPRFWCLSTKSLFTV